MELGCSIAHLPRPQNPPLLLSYAAPAFRFLARHKSLKPGRQIHARILLRGLQPDASLAAAVVAMYGSAGDLRSAHAVFQRAPSPSTPLHNSLIRAYARFGYPHRTLGLYHDMRARGLNPDSFTLPFVLKACASLNRLCAGRCVHGLSLWSGLEVDLYVGTSLVDFYAKCGEIEEAQKVFDGMTVRNAASWNALIAGYLMIGNVDVAEHLFGRMPCKNIISWTAMISGYSRNGLGRRALRLFDEMQLRDSGMKPSWVTIITVLSACADSGALERGRQIHGFVRDAGQDSNPFVQTALITMYARCGSLVEARGCFHRLGRKELGAWNAMINSYASHGCGGEAVAAFEEMMGAGVRPDAITFTALLSACSRSSLVDAGTMYFHSMRAVHGVEPSIEHYACMVDLLGRGGRLAEAKEVIDGMPLEAGPSIWGALLAASRRHRDLTTAGIAAKELFVMEPENCGNYVLLSNLCAEAGMWKEVDALRGMMEVRGLKKDPGSTWIDVGEKTSYC